MDDAFSKLEAEYCPPLDPALLSAILSDYDLSDEAAVQAARAILDPLREDASLEEAAGFDPSGTGADRDVIPGQSGPKQAMSASSSRESGVTSVSEDLSSLGLEDGFSDTDPSIASFDDLDGFEDLNEDDKVKRLRGILGDRVNAYSIRHALRKCNGNWDSAIEDLLTQAFFAEGENGKQGVGIHAKGVEGFSEDHMSLRGRKARSKARRPKYLGARRSSSVPGSGESSAAGTTNRWQSAAEDISFISTRTGVPQATISSLYYENSASVPHTIAAIIRATSEQTKHITSDEATVSSRAVNLGHDFPSISLDYRTALVRLTYPSFDTAHELATALAAKSKAADTGKLQIITQYTPLNGLDPSDNTPAPKKARSATTSRSTSFDGPAAAARRDAYLAARAEAFSKASAAHRKAKSNRLMGGAAAYYGEVGREYSALSSAARASAADALVASQSTTSSLDLHGVDVLNAVRIAREGVEDWWDGLGESRVNGRIGADERRQGFRIVVGAGTHSEGGKGKLGPAVMKMLRDEGWRVEGAGAVIVVKGKTRR